LRVPHVKADCTHGYYVYPLVLDLEYLNVSREQVFNALVAEGVEGLAKGYQNIHLLPMFQQKIAYGSKGFPWTSDICSRDVDYSKGICPTAESLHDSTFIGYEMCMNDLDGHDVDLIIKAFRKVWAQMGNL